MPVVHADNPCTDKGSGTKTHVPHQFRYQLLQGDYRALHEVMFLNGVGSCESTFCVRVSVVDGKVLIY